MKKLISLFLAVLLLLAVVPGASAAEAVVYSTDIMAYVDAHPIPSYNIGGKTCVCVEDLAWFGFDIGYDNSARTLTADAYLNENNYKFDDLKRGVLGTITGKVYRSDIKTYINGTAVKNTYNIGGKTCVCIEEIGTDARYNFSDFGGESEYGLRYIWDKTTRSINLITNVPGAVEGPHWSLPASENAKWVGNGDEGAALGFSCEFELENGEAKLINYAGSYDYIGSLGLHYGRLGLVLAIDVSYRTYLYEQDGAISRLNQCAAWRNGSETQGSAGVQALNELVRLKVNGETVTARGVASYGGNNHTTYNIYFDKYRYPENEISSVNLSVGTLEGTSVYERTPAEDYMANNEPLDESIVASAVMVYINDMPAPAYMTESLVPYVPAEALKGYGFRVKYDDAAAAVAITAPTVVPTSAPEVEWPISAIHDEFAYYNPGDAVGNYIVYGEAFKVTAGGVHIPSRYIYGDIFAENTPCVSVFELAKALGFDVDTSDPMEVRLYTPNYDPEAVVRETEYETLRYSLDDAGGKYFRIKTPVDADFGTVTDCELLAISMNEKTPENSVSGEKHTYYIRVSDEYVLSLTISGAAAGEAARQRAVSELMFYDLTLEYPAESETHEVEWNIPNGLSFDGFEVKRENKLVGVCCSAEFGAPFYSEREAVLNELASWYYKYEILEYLGGGTYLCRGVSKAGHGLFGMSYAETAETDTEVRVVCVVFPDHTAIKSLAILASELTPAEARAAA